MKTYQELSIGESACFAKTISETDVYSFAGITGDFNPLHINEQHAQTTRFKKRIAHGMLSGSLFSTIFGTHLPGEGSIYLEQNLSFKSPVFFGDTITATATVKEKLPKNMVRFDCSASNQEGTVVITGTALLKLP